MRATACGVFLVAGCATFATRVIEHRGRPETLPPSIKWCSDEARQAARNALPKQLDATTQCDGNDAFCTMSADVIRRCVRILAKDIPATGNIRIQGTLIFGMSTDERAKITDLCLIDSDLGDTPQTLDCIAQLAGEVPGMGASLTEERWRVNLFLD